MRIIVALVWVVLQISVLQGSMELFSRSSGSEIQVLRTQAPGAIMFWNLENFFDPFDDSYTADEEFTPSGAKHWTWKRFVQKRNGIAKTILASADICVCELSPSNTPYELSPSNTSYSLPEPPEIVCFAEVENYMVLHQLVEETPLQKLDYGIVHRSSPDRRGIDVALIYRKSRLRVLAVDSLRVRSGVSRPTVDSQRDNASAPTRDILYVKFLRLQDNRGSLPQNHSMEQSCLEAMADTLHIFVNHWPSKRGGTVVSAARRQAVAAVLLEAIDSILLASPSACIIATGDFNDTPENVSSLLCPSSSSGSFDSNIENKPIGERKQRLLPVRVEFPNGISGTIKYRGQWEQIDQFYVSAALKRSSGQSRQSLPRVLVFAPEFLLEPDVQYTGVRPRRTYIGPRWNEGLSDHLPILLLP